jgi:hypothetical protein
MAKRTTTKRTTTKRTTAKRTTANKTTPKKTARAHSKRKSTSRSAKPTAQAKRPDEKPRAEVDPGARIEHYRGEPHRSQRTGEPGALEEETLDRDAPYNKTYGRRDERSEN